MKLQTGGHLSFYMPGRKNSLELTLSGSTPLTEVLEQIGIPLSEVALTAINGELVEADTAVVQDADLVRIFSAVNGG
jgi:sulfur carrier protein ThiS